MIDFYLHENINELQTLCFLNDREFINRLLDNNYYVKFTVNAYNFNTLTQIILHN